MNAAKRFPDLADQARELAELLDTEQNLASGRLPIPGDQLRVGDVFLPKVGRRMRVERIEAVDRPAYPTRPLLKAIGPTTFDDGVELPDWSESYYGNEWVVVER